MVTRALGRPGLLRPGWGPTRPASLHKETEIPAVALPLMQVGKTFALKLDPANPEHPLLTIA